MGLTKQSTGSAVCEADLHISRREPTDAVIALAGNPNVGKSTVFNALTGMHQHTGNWPGKTVGCAQGFCKTSKNRFVLVDIPGTYSLSSHSEEEEIARNFICFGEPDTVTVVCDATCLERNLHLVLQILECGVRTVVCVNLMDEARKKGIEPNLERLQERLGVPVVGIVARKKQTLKGLTEIWDSLIDKPLGNKGIVIPYSFEIESAIAIVEAALDPARLGRLDSRWLAIRLLDTDIGLREEIAAYLGAGFLQEEALCRAIRESRIFLADCGIDAQALQNLLIASQIDYAEKIAKESVAYTKKGSATRDRRWDRILTGRFTAYPVMLLFLLFIFWLTIRASNMPSELLSDLLFGALDRLSLFLTSIHAPPPLIGFLVDGVLRVPAWVVSVMLPPMAIFFPLFTILEDAGFLPRIAYNLDRPFQGCNACGKQALTMCMGFGCNAAGVVGCRIIDSPRERMLAILTNALVPCNGRFPALVAIITLFLIGSGSGFGGSLLSSLLLTSVILLGILATFFATKLLSKTILRGLPSSFTLELPPFRKPQFGQVLVRSVFDRTLFVLARSVAVAVPAGAIIWILANVTVGESSLLLQCASLLDPVARLFGLDGVILLAFILGLPANEIVIPIIVMCYRAGGVLGDYGSLAELKSLLVANGWGTVTAVCTLVFFLFHWPCSTTLFTVKKETGSWKWMTLSAALPTLIGLLLCFAIASLGRILGIS